MSGRKYDVTSFPSEKLKYFRLTQWRFSVKFKRKQLKSQNPRRKHLSIVCKLSYFTGEFEFKTGKRGFVGRQLMISDCLSHCDVEKLSFSSVFFSLIDFLQSPIFR